MIDIQINLKATNVSIILMAKLDRTILIYSTTMFNAIAERYGQEIVKDS